MISKSVRITMLAEPVGTVLLIVVALLGAVDLSMPIPQELGIVVAAPKSGARVDSSEAENKLPRAGLEVFVAACNKHDAKAVAGLWTEDGEAMVHVGRDKTALYRLVGLDLLVGLDKDKDAQPPTRRQHADVRFGSTGSLNG